MRRVFFLLAILAAAVSGWTPVMAASMQLSAQASRGMAAAHASATDHRQDGDGPQHRHMNALRDDARQQSGQPGDQTHGSLHPLLCSACFALAAESPHFPTIEAITAEMIVPGVAFSGGNVLPPVPPPRPQSF